MLMCVIIHGLNVFTGSVGRYDLYSRPECPPDYAKTFIKERTINSFFCYASRTLRTTLQAVQLRSPG